MLCLWKKSGNIGMRYTTVKDESSVYTSLGKQNIVCLPARLCINTDEQVDHPSRRIIRTVCLFRRICKGNLSWRIIRLCRIITGCGPSYGKIHHENGAVNCSRTHSFCHINILSLFNFLLPDKHFTNWIFLAILKLNFPAIPCTFVPKFPSKSFCLPNSQTYIVRLNSLSK